MCGIPLGIVSHEDRIVILCGFIDHSFMRKSIEHIPINTSVVHEVCIDSAHIIVLLRQHKRFCRFLFDRRRDGQNTGRAAQQIYHRFGIGFVIETADEVNGIAAFLFVLMKPEVSANSDLL